MSCANCRYVMVKFSEPRFTFHHCHRYAPSNSKFADWPKVHPEDWCGEFEDLDTKNKS